MIFLSVATALAVLAFPLLWFALPLACRKLAVRRLRALCMARRAIVLTYDDGPNPDATPALADLLARRGVPATFFMIGRNALAHPTLVARLRAEHHEIGNHTQQHRNAWRSLPWMSVQDIRDGRRSLDQLGVPPGIFRPPYGKTTLATVIEAWRSRQPVAFWTVDTRDSWEVPRSVAEVLAAITTQDGGVVLMHDFAIAPRRPGDSHHSARVLEMTEAIIDFAQANGFALLCFSDLDRADRHSAE